MRLISVILAVILVWAIAISAVLVSMFNVEDEAEKIAREFITLGDLETVIFVDNLDCIKVDTIVMGVFFDSAFATLFVHDTCKDYFYDGILTLVPRKDTADVTKYISDPEIFMAD